VLTPGATAEQIATDVRAAISAHGAQGV
jgi:hypothetical protein